MIRDELKDEDISHDENSEYAINVENVNLGWNKTDVSLKE